jgi:hypothetical protein
VQKAEGLLGGVLLGWLPSASICTALVLLWAAGTPVGTVAADSSTLDIAADPLGGFRAKAILHIPAPPEAVRAVLTDYEHWPALFNGRFRIVELRRETERVLTDLMITRSPLPGTLRLFCETRELSGGVLVTTGLDGDFTRYARRWTLTAEPVRGAPTHAAGTRAEMELSLELRSWVPDWLMRHRLRQELLDHFEILQEKAAQHPASR